MMSDMEQDVAKLQTRQTVLPNNQELFGPVDHPQHGTQYVSPVPLYFHCLGGNWNGHIECLQDGALELRIQGMPPVQVGQELQFQCFGTPSGSPIHTQTGIVERTHIQRDTSAWKGTTILLVRLKHARRNLGSFPASQQNPLSLTTGSFVISELTKKENGHSCDMATRRNVSRQYDGSRTKPPLVINMRGNQPSPRISSSKFSIQNSSGQSIVAYHDVPHEIDYSTLPIVVIAPGYGETKRDYLTLAYYFASNGFHVIRYDHTHHVGESQGNHVDSSLSSMKDDFQAVTTYVRQAWPLSPVIGVASSLSARVALKAESQQSALNLLVLVVGVVDVQRSVTTVHQEDVFANFLNGQNQESANILGFNVGSHFLHDALTSHFSTLETTLVDVQRLETPIMYISAGKDAWIDEQDQSIFKHAINSQLSKWLHVPDALHRLQENPKTARATYRQIIQHCHEHVGDCLLERTIHEPNRADLGRQNRQEKIASPLHSPTEVGEAFWTDYLGHFQTVGSCPDYVQLLDHVFHALGPITPGQRFLDAGCGNGNAGLYFLQSLQDTRTQQDFIQKNPIRYVGIDVVHEALSRAKCQMTQAGRKQQWASTSEHPDVQMSWAQIDLQHSLPFADNHFDRIVSNLVIGYLSHPQEVLRELFRVLAPGGRMVLSNLKPNGDFSGIYQNLVSHADESNQKVDARNLLNNYGKIRQAEKEGQFRFFDQTEWIKCLNSIGGLYTGVYPTFANQAYLVVLEKPAVSAHISLLPQREAALRSQSLRNGTSPLIQAA